MDTGRIDALLLRLPRKKGKDTAMERMPLKLPSRAAPTVPEDRTADLQAVMDPSAEPRRGPGLY